MLRQIECIISGRVQGMLYRDFVRRKARGLGLVGTVENLPDGTVRVIAQGDDSDLKHLTACLKRGSMFSRVDAVDEKWSDAPQAFSDFQIVYKKLSDRL
ncbi:MAG: Acylphosphatase [Parcubacteria group bacterium GW2011_GWA2_47_16]|nr:MAG: Acylphosphatase [Parcubacteria group bacterium GW2011_GWA2_47_16]